MMSITASTRSKTTGTFRPSATAHRLRSSLTYSVPLVRLDYPIHSLSAHQTPQRELPSSSLAQPREVSDPTLTHGTTATDRLGQDRPRPIHTPQHLPLPPL